MANFFKSQLAAMRQEKFITIGDLKADPEGVHSWNYTIESFAPFLKFCFFLDAVEDEYGAVYKIGKYIELENNQTYVHYNGEETLQGNITTFVKPTPYFTLTYNCINVGSNSGSYTFVINSNLILYLSSVCVKDSFYDSQNFGWFNENNPNNINNKILNITNEFQNSNFVNTDNWSSSLSSSLSDIFVENNELILKIISDEANIGGGVSIRQQKQLIANSKYYYRFSIEAIMLEGFLGNIKTFTSPKNTDLSYDYTGGKKTISEIYIESSTTMRSIQAGFNFTETQNLKNNYFKFKQPFFVNLTSYFGVGNEPPIEWCDKYIPYTV